MQIVVPAGTRLARAGHPHRHAERPSRSARLSTPALHTMTKTSSASAVTALFGRRSASPAPTGDKTDHRRAAGGRPDPENPASQLPKAGIALVPGPLARAPGEAEFAGAAPQCVLVARVPCRSFFRVEQIVNHSEGPRWPPDKRAASPACFQQVDTPPTYSFGTIGSPAAARSGSLPTRPGRRPWPGDAGAWAAARPGPRK